MKFEFNTIAEIIQQVCADRGVKIPTPASLHLEAIFGEDVANNRRIPFGMRRSQFRVAQQWRDNSGLRRWH